MKVGFNVTTSITYKTPFVVNKQLVTVYLAIGEVVSCNTIFSWPFLKTIKSSIMTKNNYLFNGLLGDQFKMDIMVPQIYKESPKASEAIPVSLPVTIL